MARTKDKTQLRLLTVSVDLQAEEMTNLSLSSRCRTSVDPGSVASEAQHMPCVRDQVLNLHILFRYTAESCVPI